MTVERGRVIAVISIAGALLASLLVMPASAGAAEASGSDPSLAAARTIAKAPVITGTPQVGRKLSVVQTSQYKRFKRSGSLRFQWYADGRRLAGKRGSSLALTPGLVGKRIAVKLTARTGSGHRVAKRVSRRTSAVRPGDAPLIRTIDPAVRSTAADFRDLVPGSVLTAPTFGVSGMGYSFQWTGVTDAAQVKRKSYVLRAADMGSTVSVTVTGALRGYKSRVWKSERIVLPSVAYGQCRAAALVKNGLQSDPNPVDNDLISEYIVDLVNCERQEIGVPVYAFALEMKAGSNWWAEYLKSVDIAVHPERLCAPNCSGSVLKKYWNGTLGYGVPSFGFTEAPGSYVDHYENGVWVGAEFVADGSWVAGQYDLYGFGQAAGINSGNNKVEAARSGVTSWMTSPPHCGILLDYSRTRAYSGVSYRTDPFGHVVIFRTLDTYVSPHILLGDGRYAVSDDQYSFASQEVRNNLDARCEGH